MRRTSTLPATDDRFPVPLRGASVDDETRCAHYDTPRDIVALRFACCDCYYPCAHCHDAVTDHAVERVQPRDFDDSAVLCGDCFKTMSVRTYLDCGDRCPNCGTEFNPGCCAHRDRYFALDDEQ
jgi:uncharacterized CHY-type Zn-finger protein